MSAALLEGPPDAEVQAAIEAQVMGEIAASSRNWPVTLGQMIAGALLAVVFSLPFARDAVGPGPALLFASVVFLLPAGLVTFRRYGGRSAAFYAAHTAELLAVSGGPMVLMFLGGSAKSAWWFLHVAILLINVTVPYERIHGAFATFSPLALAAAFLLAGDVDEALTAIVIGAAVAFLYWVPRRSLQRRAEDRYRLEWLRDRLAEERANVEKRRVARDLHDGLGAELTALYWQARDLEADRSSSAPLAEAAGAALAELRAIVDGLAPEPASAGDIGAALATRLERLAVGRAEVSVEVDDDVRPRVLSSLTRAHHERAAVEAVRNALRHAGASSVRVRLHACTTGVCLEVRDDGHGFDPAAASRGGLAYMAARADELGGTFEVASGRDGGTSLRLALPV